MLETRPAMKNVPTISPFPSCCAFSKSLLILPRALNIPTTTATHYTTQSSPSSPHCNYGWVTYQGTYSLKSFGSSFWNGIRPVLWVGDERWMPRMGFLSGGRPGWRGYVSLWRHSGLLTNTDRRYIYLAETIGSEDVWNGSRKWHFVLPHCQMLSVYLTCVYPKCLFINVCVGYWCFKGHTSGGMCLWSR